MQLFWYENDCEAYVYAPVTPLMTTGSPSRVSTDSAATGPQNNAVSFAAVTVAPPSYNELEKNRNSPNGLIRGEPVGPVPVAVCSRMPAGRPGAWSPERS